MRKITLDSKIEKTDLIHHLQVHYKDENFRNIIKKHNNRKGENTYFIKNMNLHFLHS